MRKAHELRRVEAASKISHFATMIIIIRGNDLFVNFGSASQIRSICPDPSNLHALVLKNTKHLSSSDIFFMSKRADVYKSRRAFTGYMLGIRL